MNVLWADDEFECDLKIKAICKEIEKNMQKENVTINWISKTDSADAYKTIDYKEINFGFALIDVEFLKNNEKQAISAIDLSRKLENRKIYFAIYSNFIEDREMLNNPYCIGIYKKGLDDDNLIKDLREFFICPPFRIIQISDLHYNLDMDEVDRQTLISSINNIIKKINAEKSIDIIAIIGDLVAKRTAEELGYMNEILNKIFEEINIDKERIFIVPGNHEVNWDNYSLNKRSKNAYTSFANFYNTFFSREIICKSNGNNNGQLPISITADGLSWKRFLKNPNVSIIGICSNSEDESEKGKGKLSNDQIKYIKENWRNDKDETEFRILMLHHNFFPIQSFNSMDESKTITNTGALLTALSEAKCDLILCGHTHRSEVILYQSSTLSDSGYKRNKSLLLSATGTSGGNPTTGDYARQFNVIDVSKDINTNNMQIEITPYHYDSRLTIWNKKEAAKYEICMDGRK